MTFKTNLTISLLVLALLPLASLSAELQGLVVRIVDDTLVLLVEGADGQRAQEKVRLAGIDCPEHKQAWGQRAKQALSGYVFSREVTVDWTKRDRYKRIVGKILDRERDVNLALVRDGMCWWYRKYANEQSRVDRGLYEAAEVKARTRRVGLWSDPDPVPPWEWRHR
jgi:endonuclease YncB( thermonuclease family)